MRYVIFGAGAVGGVIGGRLHASGRDVVLIARGAHLDAIRRDGLRLLSPDEQLTLSIPVAANPAEVTFAGGDVVILAVKTQDTGAALSALIDAAPPDIRLVCAQNGVENERLCLRHFDDVHGMPVILAGSHLIPGVVEVNTAPIAGVLDVGRYSGGVDATTRELAADLNLALFDSRPLADVMRWKYAKLLSNLGNALEAALGPQPDDPPLLARARDEALACYTAAGIDAASDAETAARWGALPPLRRVAGARRGGGSSWQSLVRGQGSAETDFLNGEIVLLGRTCGVPTPVNAMLQGVVGRMARQRLHPGSLTADDLEAELRQHRASDPRRR